MRLNYKSVLSGILAFGLLLSGSLVFGQVTATLNGRALDPSGDVVPGARVVITNETTGAIVRTTTTNAQGYYSAPNLASGRYSMKADAPGFKRFERTGIVLDVASIVEANVAFSVGGASQTVTVQADSEQVQTESSDVNTIISGTQISEIELNGRNPFQLAMLAPGASNSVPQFQNPVAINSSGNAIIFNGERKQQNVFLIDGAEIYDRGCGGCYEIEPSQNGVSEFKVIASNAPGNIGMASGGIVSLSLKSGTKDFHASAWEYDRNDDFDAKNYLAKQNGTVKPKLRYNIFGFNAGGPVIIPHIYGKKRDKTFFFYDMEWRRQIQGNQILALAVPSTVAGGNFGSSNIKVPSTTDPNAIAKFASYNLVPGQQFPNNTIPSGLIDPNVKLLLQAGIFPAPNTPGGQFFSSAVPVATNIREELVRIDHKINDKLSLDGSLVFESGFEQQIPGSGSNDSYSIVGSTFNIPSYVAAIRLADVISSNLVNQIAFDFNGNKQKILPYGLYTLPAGYGGQSFFPSANTLNSIPTINLGAPYSVNYDVGTTEPYHNAYGNWEYKDDLSWLHGKHSMMIGGSFMLYHKQQTLSGYPQGRFGFTGSFTGNSFADFLLGYAGSYSQLELQNPVNVSARTLTFYATDAWKATSRMTLNYGLRWEYLPHVFEMNGRLSNFNPVDYQASQEPAFTTSGAMVPTGPGFSTVTVPQAIQSPFYLNGMVLAGRNGTPRGLVNNYLTNFAPRFGFAYGVTSDQKTVLRGGFGMFYNRTNAGDPIRMGTNAPFDNTPTASNVYFSTPATSATNGQAAAEPIFPATVTAVSTYYPIPTSMQYSLGIQRQLSTTSVLTIGYVGSHNYHQSYDADLNAVPLADPNRLAICGANCGYHGTSYNANLDRNYPGFSHITYQTTGLNSHYDSLQTTFSMRMSNDLSISAAYTYAHSLDFGSNDLALISDPYNPAYDHGNSDFDRRHIAQFSYYYHLPFFRTSGDLLAREALGGWQISGITSAETGQPQSVTLGYDNTGLGGSETSRADQVAPVQYTKTQAHWVSYSSFAAPAPLTFGDSARNVLFGPGLFNWNMALFKSFRITERTRFEFRGETFNTFNHTEFQNVSTTYSSGPNSFGKVTSVYDPREIQLGGTLTF